MRNPILLSVITVFLICSNTITATQSSPKLSELKLVTHLPPELPQRISGIAYDGEKLWVVIYQGKGRYATLDPMTHGLVWDGTRLWHMKDNRLSSIDSSTGELTATYILDQIKRASGLAWDGEALWIAEFDGNIWRLPFPSL